MVNVRWIFALLLYVPMLSFASIPVKSIVIFGDSLSDNGNTTHLLKSLRREENPTFLVTPLKIFVVNKMAEYAEEYYVPLLLWESSIALVNNFFDNDLAPCLAALVSKVKSLPVLPGKPYWNSRFSNGKVWNEYLAQMMSFSEEDERVYLNRSFGGSWAVTYDSQFTIDNLFHHPRIALNKLIAGKLIPPSLGLAVQAYLLEHRKVGDDTLFFIFTGNNDYVNMLANANNYNPERMSIYIDNVLSNIDSSVKKLMKAGARHFIIMGIPRIGDSPRMAQKPDGTILNAAVELHNTRLKNHLPEWQNRDADSSFLFIDMSEYLQRALKNPTDYGFINTSESCIDVKMPAVPMFKNALFANNYVLLYSQMLHYKDAHFLPGEVNYKICDEPDNYLFWDELHPSTRAHAYLAFEICQELVRNGYSVSCKNPLSDGTFKGA